MMEFGGSSYSNKRYRRHEGQPFQLSGNMIRQDTKAPTPSNRLKIGFAISGRVAFSHQLYNVLPITFCASNYCLEDRGSALPNFQGRDTFNCQKEDEVLKVHELQLCKLQIINLRSIWAWVLWVFFFFFLLTI